MIVSSRSRKTKSKKGYAKIEKTCEIARTKYGLNYAWVDTCCIDKSSSAELSEAINSMFKWYQKAELCFAFLPDMTSDHPTFQKSRWFTRGWTLQELIAPRDVMFFDGSWTIQATKVDHAERIHKITGIPRSVLINPARYLSTIPVVMRMSWASSRMTTRPEDLAYSLLGIFDINMPLLYGEGEKAFTRLQEEIIKQNPDLSIFAWTDPNPVSGSVFSGILAPSLAYFRRVEGIQRKPDIQLSHRDFSITNRGVRFHLPLGRDENSGCLLLPMDYYRSPMGSECLAVFLRQIGPDLFVRASPESLTIVNSFVRDIPFQVPKYLSESEAREISFHCLHFSMTEDLDDAGFQLLEVEPQGCWDPTQQLIYAGHTRVFQGYLIFEPLLGDLYDYFVVVLVFNGAKWRCELIIGNEWPNVKRQFWDYYREQANKNRLTGAERDHKLTLPHREISSTQKRVNVSFAKNGASFNIDVSTWTCHDGLWTSEYRATE